MQDVTLCAGKLGQSYLKMTHYLWTKLTAITATD